MHSRLPSLAVDKVLVLPGSFLQHLCAKHLNVLPTHLLGLVRGNLELDVRKALDGGRLQLFNEQHPGDRERVVRKESTVHCLVQRRVQRAAVLLLTKSYEL